MNRFLMSIAALVISAQSAIANPALFNAVAAKRYDEAIAIGRNSGNDLLAAYARWAALSSPSYQGMSFDEAYNFLNTYADWPLQNRVRVSVEAAMFTESASSANAKTFCLNFPPISGRGLIACARLLPANNPKVAAMIKQGWQQGDFNAAEEQIIRARYADILSQSDHIKRTERLLFASQVSAAMRMLPLLPSESATISRARIGLQTSAKNADALLANVPAKSRNSAGLIFDRIRYRHAKGLESGVFELFAHAPKNPPYADSWWGLRNLYTRKALETGQYSRALAIISNAGDLSPINKAEALWLSGWLRHEFLNDSRRAYEDFYALYKSVQTPVSKARAAYWAARAAERNGNPDIARDWLARASAYPTVFYGQLAFAKQFPNRPLPLPSSLNFSASDKAAFDKRSIVRMIHLLSRAGQEEYERLFMEHLGGDTDSPTQMALAANLAQTIGEPHNAVRVAKAALRKNVVLLKQGWPVRKVPANAAIEPALALAISRQESEFDATAVSSANARGLMQILPSTAAHIAKKISEPYVASRLFEPAYNMLLGSAYLGHMIENAGGGYITAIASYNAGPGNTYKWIQKYGRPGKSLDSSLRFIETIPFGETRNYVQRVLENLQMYRAISSPSTPLAIEKDLLR